MKLTYHTLNVLLSVAMLAGHCSAPRVEVECGSEICRVPMTPGFSAGSRRGLPLTANERRLHAVCDTGLAPRRLVRRGGFSYARGQHPIAREKQGETCELCDLVTTPAAAPKPRADSAVMLIDGNKPHGETLVAPKPPTCRTATVSVIVINRVRTVRDVERLDKFYVPRMVRVSDETWWVSFWRVFVVPGFGAPSAVFLENAGWWPACDAQRIAPCDIGFAVENKDGFTVFARELWFVSSDFDFEVRNRQLIRKLGK